MPTWSALYLASEWLIRIVMLVWVPQKRSPEAARTWLLFIFVLPPSFAQLKERLVKRGLDDPDVISRRLAMARKEIRAYPQFDYLIVNDKLETAQKELEAIILGERCRLQRRQKGVIPILRSFSEPE